MSQIIWIAQSNVFLKVGTKVLVSDLHKDAVWESVLNIERIEKSKLLNAACFFFGPEPAGIALSQPKVRQLAKTRKNWRRLPRIASRRERPRRASSSPGRPCAVTGRLPGGARGRGAHGCDFWAARLISRFACGHVRTSRRSQSKGSGGLARGCATAATVGCLPWFHHPGPVAMVPVQLRAGCSGKRRTQVLRRRSLYGASVVCCGCLFANLSNTRAPTLFVGTMRTLSRLEADAHDAYVNLTCRR